MRSCQPLFEAQVAVASIGQRFAVFSEEPDEVVADVHRKPHRFPHRPGHQRVDVWQGATVLDNVRGIQSQQRVAPAIPVDQRALRVHML